MRRFTLTLVLSLALPFCANAQAPAGNGIPAHTGKSHGVRTHVSMKSDYPAWQVSIGYQYNRDNLVGSPFTTNGANVGVTRFLNRWFGLDGQAGFGFGNTGATTSPANLNAQSLFVGGGPRVAWRNQGRLEPWLHLVIGMDRFRFTQTAGVLGNNTALAGAGGGGVDYVLGHRLSARAEVDAIESRFFSTYQRHFQAETGLVFSF